MSIIDIPTITDVGGGSPEELDEVLKAILIKLLDIKQPLALVQTPGKDSFYIALVVKKKFLGLFPYNEESKIVQVSIGFRNDISNKRHITCQLWIPEARDIVLEGLKKYAEKYNAEIDLEWDEERLYCRKFHAALDMITERIWRNRPSKNRPESHVYTADLEDGLGDITYYILEMRDVKLLWWTLPLKRKGPSIIVIPQHRLFLFGGSKTITCYIYDKNPNIEAIVREELEKFANEYGGKVQIEQCYKEK